jgi:hypothetical protein
MYQRLRFFLFPWFNKYRLPYSRPATNFPVVKTTEKKSADKTETPFEIQGQIEKQVQVGARRKTSTKWYWFFETSRA